MEKESNQMVLFLNLSDLLLMHVFGMFFRVSCSLFLVFTLGKSSDLTLLLLMYFIGTHQGYSFSAEGSFGPASW